MEARQIFSQNEYDLLIVGGGINGAALAHLASRQGLRVALLEKGDFASGTSSKSTKLIHGGLRYLENFELALVRESLRERFIQLKSAPHLVRPISFVIPVYKGDARPLWMLKLGVSLYDFLSGKFLIDKRRSLTAGEIAGLIPGIKTEGLLGGIEYFDAQMDDARLCLENVLSAKQHGAHVANYVEAKSFIKENGRVVGINARDMISQKNIRIRAYKVVCAAGPWSNKLLRMDNVSSPDHVRTTKGIHIIYNDRVSDVSLLLQVKKDKRVFFVIPFGAHSLIGTTDTDYTGNPDKVEADTEDIEYLLSEAKRVFPDRAFNQEGIVATFAGLRPLVYKEGNPSKVSRRHVIEKSFSGVTFILGGKYTTYRKIAADCFKKLYPGRELGLMEEFSVYGSGDIKESTAEIARQFEMDNQTVDYLKGMYGSRYMDVLRLTQREPQWRGKICTCTQTILAQVIYSMETELARTADDVIWRRLGLGYAACETKECRKAIQHAVQTKN